jgi:hypothetical protein
MKKTKVFWLIFLTSLFMAAGTSAASPLPQSPTAGTVPVSMIVSVEARHGKEVPTVYKQDVRVTQGNDRLEVTDWTPCQSAQSGVELFVLVDDSTNPEIGLQFDDLKKFMQAQPPATAIGVAYARNGFAQVVQNLTRDHAQAAKALRLPQGFSTVASPYLSVTDLVKKWPQSTNCREIVMVSSGIDYLQGGPQDTYLAQSIDQAQRAAIQVYAIYAQPLGHAGHDFFRLNWGQNNLSQLTDETGGEFYIQGVTPPIAYAPYLAGYADRLTHQFRLTFLAKPAEKAGLQRVHLDTEVTNAELVGQDEVYVPAK